VEKGEFRGHAAVEAALEAALSLLPGPAFAFDADGQVLAANVTISDDHLTRARACLLNPDPQRARLARRDPAAVVLLVETERDAALARAKQRWRLTPKQSEILGHLVSGASNKEIATLLDCSLSNVEAHLTALLRRTGCSSRGELIAAFWGAR
jgi:DNA-binding CsgD family transcriptional regulator